MEKQKKYFISTMGCQMNVYDSEVLAGYLESMGFAATTGEEDADILILNTCAVRQKAEEKVLSRLGMWRNLKQSKPGMLMVLWGCMVQQGGIAGQIRKRYPYIDLIGGPHALGRFPELLEEARISRTPVIAVAEEERRGREFPVKRRHTLFAWVPISYGCNNYCTYCIVPYVRGPEKSRLPADIIAEVEKLAHNGYREVTLLGQNVNSYGRDLNEQMDFADLLQMVARIPGLLRIRYMTSHPRDFTEKMIAIIAQEPKICEHFHLPLQAGSNHILTLMNRGYTREVYLKLVERIRELVPRSSITTDFIVGFPGEREEDFGMTMDMLEKVRFDAAFTFIYSPRQGTKAAAMADQISDTEKRARIITLNNRQTEIGQEINAQLLGTRQELLVEGKSKTDHANYTGRTRTNKIVHFPANEVPEGSLVTVEITEAGAWTLRGKYISADTD
ncbi:MAG: tRNA (N6-isopentenyl adenosine(37)-C2)-methylthiotransferase MiaB [Bacillota bacterium]